MAKANDEMFFVEIRDPTLVQKSILESLRDIVESLQRFEKYKEFRQKKLGLIAQLQKNVKEINKHMGTIRGMFPESQVKIMLKPVQKAAEQPKQKKKKAPSKVPMQGRPASEVEKLASQLSAIEDKLKELQ